MSQVSKRFISKEIEDRMLEIFWQSLASCSTKETVASFLEDLLTPTEKIMLSKRVSIALLLLKGYDYKSINNILKVSAPTIWTVSLWLKTKGKGYRMVLKRIIQNEKWDKLWQNVEKQIQDILPPRPGTNWAEVRKRQWEKRRQQQKPY
ncbi:MAG: Trp family transcriptional regulator [Patescibacteria group bacterium]|nr:Trp family transcriptional regulator [Patescibacteria group bacterium]MCL5095203.1 Trp family transcriptional regulator [Patescibacteria group bacterium]